MSDFVHRQCGYRRPALGLKIDNRSVARHRPTGFRWIACLCRSRLLDNTGLSVPKQVGSLMVRALTVLLLMSIGGCQGGMDSEEPGGCAQSGELPGQSAIASGGLVSGPVALATGPTTALAATLRPDGRLVTKIVMLVSSSAGEVSDLLVDGPTPAEMTHLQDASGEVSQHVQGNGEIGEFPGHLIVQAAGAYTISVVVDGARYGPFCVEVLPAGTATIVSPSGSLLP